MSAVTKPMARFTNSKTPSILVPVEWVQSVEKRDIPVGPTGAPAKYSIVLTSVFPTGMTKETNIEFTTSAARDTSFTNYETAFVTSVA